MLRKMILTAILTVPAITALPVSAIAKPVPAQSVALTVYNQNFAVVKDRRQMPFSKGLSQVKFTDVASAIDPTSVSFKCISSPENISILEQNYEYDLVNPMSLMKRYIDKTVTVEIKGTGADKSTWVTANLASANSRDLILEQENGKILIVNSESIGQIQLADRPDNLVTKPTLVWLADSKTSGNQLCQVTYMTNSISWKADYSAVLNDKEDRLDISGWVTIDNNSGKGYKDAMIKLVAGDVRKVRQPMAPRKVMMDTAYGMGERQERGFEEKAFMDYHMYTLGRKTTVNNNQVKQIELIEPVDNVIIDKLYVYQWQQNEKNVKVKVEFVNNEQNNIGIPLPMGKVRVFKRDKSDETLEFVGEDMIDHTARKEKVSLYIGDAFDITAKHTLTDSKHGRNERTDTHKIELRNAKDSKVVVKVQEDISSNRNWVIVNSTHGYTKKDADTVEFDVSVNADSETVFEYKIRQWW